MPDIEGWTNALLKQNGDNDEYLLQYRDKKSWEWVYTKWTSAEILKKTWYDIIHLFEEDFSEDNDVQTENNTQIDAVQLSERLQETIQTLIAWYNRMRKKAPLDVKPDVIQDAEVRKCFVKDVNRLDDGMYFENKGIYFENKKITLSDWITYFIAPTLKTQWFNCGYPSPSYLINSMSTNKEFHFPDDAKLDFYFLLFPQQLEPLKENNKYCKVDTIAKEYIERITTAIAKKIETSYLDVRDADPRKKDTNTNRKWIWLDINSTWAFDNLIKEIVDQIKVIDYKETMLWYIRDTINKKLEDRKLSSDIGVVFNTHLQYPLWISLQKFPLYVCSLIDDNALLRS